MITDKEYPLYPELPEPGAQQAQALIDRFKEQVKKAAEECIDDFYTDIVPHIESDSWTNYRNAMMDGFREYGNRMTQGEHDFKKIRQQIYKDFRDEIVADLNQDLVKEIERLKGTIQTMQKYR
jgi:hypothetical protein